MSSFLDGGAGFVLSMVQLSPNIEQQKQVYNRNAKDVGVVYNELTNPLSVYWCLLTNH